MISRIVANENENIRITSTEATTYSVTFTPIFAQNKIVFREKREGISNMEAKRRTNISDAPRRIYHRDRTAICIQR